MRPVVLPEDDVRYVTRNSLSFSCVSCRVVSCLLFLTNFFLL